MIAAGGTGGHLYPGIALAQAFKKRGPEAQVSFVGTGRGLENSVIREEGYDLHLIRIRGWLGVGFLKRILALLELPYSLVQSYRLLRAIRPNLVIGIGGYASGPLVLMAWVCRIPQVLVEPNAAAGLTNRILAPFVRRIYLAFEEARDQLFANKKIRVYGNPVRDEVLNSSAGPKEKVTVRTILVMGGSQGAHSINRAMVEALKPLESLRDRLRIIHQTGERDYHWVHQAYEQNGFTATVTPFLKNIANVYSISELVISRAGATTIAELTACGIPSILIPFPYATHHHQELNANILKKGGAAILMRDSDLNGAILASQIYRLLRNSMELHEMALKSRSFGRPDAAEKIMNECLDIMKQEGG